MNLMHHFLMAMPGLGDEAFAKSVVYMCEHSDRGALGPGGESLYASSMTIPGGLEMTTSKGVPDALPTGAGPRKVFVSLGSSAWGQGRLESEIPDNSWRTVPAELRYDKALLLPGLHRGMLSSEAGYA